jgi:hypothetical protein
MNLMAIVLAAQQEQVNANNRVIWFQGKPYANRQALEAYLITIGASMSWYKDEQNFAVNMPKSERVNDEDFPKPALSEYQQTMNNLGLKESDFV